MIGVLDLLRIKNWAATKRTRFVRHQDKRFRLDELRRDGFFELYQQYQGAARFHNVDYVVSFYGGTQTRAVFYGIYRVKGFVSAKKGRIAPECSDSQEWHDTASFFYDLEPLDEFLDLRDRLVIDWGKGARSWVQLAKNRPVLELREPGRSLPPFDDYLEFSLGYDQLQDLFGSPEAHHEWRAQLSAVAGIYLILAETTGALYVGSATGERGVWGRWEDYARSGHGGNAKLRKLLAEDKAYPAAFRFSLLQILPKSMARDLVLQREHLYMLKLGSKATGLNT
jgi:hypothetical protein